MCWGGLEEVKNGFVFGEVAGCGDVAAVEEDVAGGEGVAVGVREEGTGERRSGVGVGDYAEAGFDCCGRHAF